MSAASCSPQRSQASGVCCDGPHATDYRCHCGSLLARVVTGGVELKCRRCKRTMLVPFGVGFAKPGTAAG